MTLCQTLNNLSQKFIPISDSPLLDAEILLSFILKKDKTFLYTYPGKKITITQEKKIKNLARRRQSGVPIAYLVGKKDFYGLTFFVNKNVLIPRPESELLIDETLKLITPKIKTIIDIGTGSGCLAITLAKKLPNIKIFASDFSAQALVMAKKNARQHKVKIKFIKGNLLIPFKKKKSDIIIANLPYVPKKKSYHKNELGLKFEPSRALYSGKDGLNAYRSFFSQIKKIKYLPQYILIEHDPRQTATLHKIIKNHLCPINLITKKDLCGLDRLTIIQLPQRSAK